MSESDGMNEVFDDAVRQAMMVAARLGEQLARQRQERLTQARRVSEHAAQEMQARFDAERLSARTALSSVDDRDWWKTASPEQIGAAYQTATAWREHDPEIAARHAQIERKLDDRGIGHTGPAETVTELIRAREWAAQYEPALSDVYTRELINTKATDRERMNNALVASYLARPDSQLASAADDERAAAISGRTAAARQRGAASLDVDAGAALRGEGNDLNRRADEHERAAGRADASLIYTSEVPPEDPYGDELPPPAAELIESQRDERAASEAHRAADASYDSADRRTALANKLEGTADKSDVKARLLADLSQGTPATAAVGGKRPNAPAARKNKVSPTRSMKMSSR